jgi:hypothetical protein
MKLKHILEITESLKTAPTARPLPRARGDRLIGSK